MMTGTEIVFGRDEAAGRKWVCEGAYRIVESDSRGKFVDGYSPDGRTEGMCSRCATCISRVYVFGDGSGTFMHVGIDCAQRMGIPREEIDRARHWFRDAAREAAEKVRRASIAERRAAEEAERAARLVANADLVDELRAFAAHPKATTWERDRALSLINYVADNGSAFAGRSEYLNDCEGGEAAVRALTSLNAIRARLELCETSREVKGDKKGALIATLTVYRDPIPLMGAYGTTWVNFLRDDGGNAYVYKGTKSARCGSVIAGTFTVDGTDERDGLIATRITRPRKATIRRIDDHGTLADPVEW